MQPNAPLQSPWHPPGWLAPLALAGLIWFSHFFWSSKFGIYEDDYINVEVMMNLWKLPQLKEGISYSFREYHQGRPLHFTIGHTIAYITTQPGGTFKLAYLTGFGIQVLNAWLVLVVAQRILGARLAAAAAAIFAIAPAITTHQFLHICFYVQPSVTFMLLALIAYQRGWRAISYLPAALTLITYETCFLPLLAAPLLTPERPSARRLVAHAVVMGAILLAALTVRSSLGDGGRTREELADKSVAVKKALRLATLGPATSARALVSKPESAAERLSNPAYFTGDGLKPLAGAWAILAAAGFGTVLLFAGARAADPIEDRPLMRVALAGAAMLVLSYPVALNRNPLELEGRMSSVHIAGCLGWALLLSAMLGLALRALPRTGRRAVWALVALHLATLAAYHVTVQRDYALGWAEQRRFWGTVNRLCPDIADDDVILYPYPPRVCEAVEVNSHADYLLTQRMFYHLPPWKNPPLAVHVGIHITGLMPTDYAGYAWPEVKVEDGGLVFQHWTGKKLPMRSDNVIALYPDGNGGYRRLRGELEIHGVRLPLRDPGPPNPHLLPTHLRWQLAPP
jgi:hypothetical protein